LEYIQKIFEKNYLFTLQLRQKRHFQTPSPYETVLHPFLRTLVLGYVLSENSETITFSTAPTSTPKTTTKQTIKN
jgi:hypothetical protein